MRIAFRGARFRRHSPFCGRPLADDGRGRAHGARAHGLGAFGARLERALHVLRRYRAVTLLPQILRCQIDRRGSHTATQPDRTGEFPVSAQRGWPGVAAVLTEQMNSDGLAVFYVGSPPSLLIVICRCQDCGSSANEDFRVRDRRSFCSFTEETDVGRSPRSLPIVICRCQD